MEPGVLTLKMISSLPPFLWTTRTKFRHTEPLIVKNLKWKYFPLHGHYYSFEIKLNRCFICVYSSLEQCFHNHQNLHSTSLMNNNLRKINSRWLCFKNWKNTVTFYISVLAEELLTKQYCTFTQNKLWDYCFYLYVFIRKHVVMIELNSKLFTLNWVTRLDK